MRNNTEALSSAFDDADSKLEDLESERASTEEDVKSLQGELDVLVKALSDLAKAEADQQAVVDAAYDAWSKALDAASEDEEVYEIDPSSEYSKARYQ
jgi:predicted nuclease with TOPRIM domain